MILFSSIITSHYVNELLKKVWKGSGYSTNHTNSLFITSISLTVATLHSLALTLFTATTLFLKYIVLLFFLSSEICNIFFLASSCKLKSKWFPLFIKSDLSMLDCMLLLYLKFVIFLIFSSYLFGGMVGAVGEGIFTCEMGTWL